MGDYYMIIRKVSVGNDYKNAMNYVLGQPVMKDSHVIQHILREDDGSITIWVINDENEIIAWKSISKDVPVSIEYSINF